jgi:endonuclease/exonuclease/phosphatase family metal-dependent hydrolase
MPFYPGLRRVPFTDVTRVRCAERLLKLRKQLHGEIPPRTSRDTLLLATWNIRDFDSNKFGHGPRIPESLYYIAEIISAFDLVAVQEVSRDLRALRKVVDILGPDWTYFVNDVTDGSAGNNERTAFVYDKNKILFRNIVGEIVLPENQLIGERRQFSRTPFFVSFQAGWFKFNLCTAHLYFGSDSGEALERRIQEIDRLADIASKRGDAEGENYILLGDFNIVSPDHRTMEALTRHGFIIPERLQRSPSNMYRTKHYDQIAFKVREGELQLGDSESHSHAGALNYYDSVFPEKEWETYYNGFEPAQRTKWDFDGDHGDAPRDDEGRRSYFWREWRTFQMSDHLPLWVELKIDFSERYLTRLSST